MENMKKEIINKAKNHGLILDETTIEFANIGLDFQVAFGTDQQGTKWVLRLPRRKDAFLKTKKEKQTLDLLHKASLPFEVPIWEIYSEELIGYQILSGEPAVTTDSETQENHWVFDEKDVPEIFTQSLGQALATLHSIPIKSELKDGATSEKLKTAMSQRMDVVKESYAINDELWLRWQRWLENDDLWPQEVGFIHGDLYPGHMLIDEDFSVTGIIDWTEAKVSNVSNDFTAHYMLFGEEELEKLILAYQKAGGYTWPKMKEHIIELLATQAITLAEFAESSGIDDYKEIAKEMLKNGH